MVDPEPGGWEDPKPRIKRQCTEDCGSLGEFVQYPAGGCAVGSRGVHCLKAEQSLLWRWNHMVRGRFKHILNDG